MTDRPAPRHPPAPLPSFPTAGWRLAAGLLALFLALRLPADDERTSDRWDAVAEMKGVRPLAEVPATARPLLDWFDTPEGARVLGTLVNEGRVELPAGGEVCRREVGMAGYIRGDGRVVRLGSLMRSEWYAAGESARVNVGKATAGVPWAVHTHGWGNSMSGITRGISGDFLYATDRHGPPGILVCLPLREKDGTECVDTGRFQMIVPTAEGVGCFEGRWVRAGDQVIVL